MKTKTKQKTITDTERLDWLERTGSLVNRPYHGEEPAHCAVYKQHMIEHHSGKNYRHAIDKAMRGEKSNSTNVL